MIYIVPDTNFLRIPYKEKSDYTKFYMNKNFQELYSFIHSKENEGQIELAVPQLVWRELQQHKFEAYVDVCENIKMLFNCIGDYGKKELYVTIEEYNKILAGQISNFIEANALMTIPLCEDRWFKSIIERAITKIPPFEGKEKESDKGLKDVAIWYSLLSFSKDNPGEFIFITGDKIFYKEQTLLVREFAENTGNNIFFCKNFEEVRQHFADITPKNYIDAVDVNYEVQEIILRHTNSQYRAQLHYTQPKVFAVEDVLTFINKDIKSVYDDAIFYWDNIDLGWSEGEVEYSGTGSLIYEVRYNQNGILAFLFKGEIYLGGPHGTPIQIGRVYDLNTGKRLGLCELLRKDENTVMRLIYESWKRDKKERGNDVYWDDFGPNYKSIDDVQFYLDDVGIHIFFDVYEAACYADGFVEFVLIDEKELINQWTKNTNKA